MANPPAVNKAVANLAGYALRKGLIEECECMWAVNSILDVLKLDGWEETCAEPDKADLAAVLDTLLDDAHARGVLAEDSVVYRDLLDSELMGRLTPRPAQVIEKFRDLYARSPEAATDWYYEFSQDTNYIRRDRIAKDVQWKTSTEYGELDITINLSKLVSLVTLSGGRVRISPTSDKIIMKVGNVGLKDKALFILEELRRLL